MHLCGPKATLHFIPTLLHTAQRLASRHSGSVVNRFQSRALMMVTIPGRLGRWVHILYHSAQVIHTTHLVNTKSLWLNIVFVLNHLMSKIRENKSNQCFYRALQATRSEGWRMVTSKPLGVTQGYFNNPLWILNLTSVYLFVFPVPPKIYDISNDMTINEGTNVTLTCLATGKPEPAISWRHISPSGECRPAALAVQRVSEPLSFPSSFMGLCLQTAWLKETAGMNRPSPSVIRPLDSEATVFSF